MTKEEQDKLLLSIDKAFGLTKDDFVDGRPIYTVWGLNDDQIDVENLGEYSLKISKNLGDVYIDKISTDAKIVVGVGTTLHCDDIHAGLGITYDFEGFLM